MRKTSHHDEALLLLQEERISEEEMVVSLDGEMVLGCMHIYRGGEERRGE